MAAGPVEVGPFTRTVLTEADSRLTGVRIGESRRARGRACYGVARASRTCATDGEPTNSTHS